ncbi:hypothetical protein FD50_GL000530 [Liquorilactobacillus satsumensis DSM 16230 = JCM 12392]|uniref:Uncharacterized protein n=1 Tax=Liquorilactobacillus satsumensis DSM 16230 = JCM 12392 TaxID=1423801 RepID=A0A0R1V6L3_9LACO|nr:hypothetical protein FD50_GL000530 [Liquorilactobacillus satsumensis DSM 16230 = JCM 12392]
MLHRQFAVFASSQWIFKNMYRDFVPIASILLIQSAVYIMGSILSKLLVGRAMEA